MDRCEIVRTLRNVYEQLLKLSLRGDLENVSVSERGYFSAVDTLKYIFVKIDGRWRMVGLSRMVKVLDVCDVNEFGEKKVGAFIIQELKRKGEVHGYKFSYYWYSHGYEYSGKVDYESQYDWFISDKPILLVVHRDYYDDDPEWASKWEPYTYRKEVEPRTEIYNTLKQIFEDIYRSKLDFLKEIKSCAKLIKKYI